MYIVRSDINHISHTKASWEFHSLDDYYQVVVDLEKKIETNRSDASQSENPIVAPIDKVIDTLPKQSEERSSILIEPKKQVNISI